MDIQHESSKDAFVGKVLSELMNAISELQVRSEVLTRQVAHLRAEVEGKEYEEAIDALEKEVEQTFNRQLDQLTQAFTSSDRS